MSSPVITTPLRWLLAWSIILLVLLAGMQSLVSGPDPDDLDFDTASAFAIAGKLIPDHRPHPTGSTENSRVKARISAELQDYGYQVMEQNETWCTDFSPGCSRVQNLYAIKSGSRPDGDAIMLTAHYDSVPGTPGAGDDIAGVAAMLQIARELSQATTLRNDVIFLFADAEETGLRGAMAFAEGHPLMQRVKLVINLEARGASGPSALFETSAGNARLVREFAAVASRPVGTSLMYEVYRKMPNNTDLTIYKKAGAMGMNFAFSRSAALYHSARDDLQHLSQTSLGHHGDNMLQLVRRFADLDMATLQTSGDATYLDVAGRYLLSWPNAINLPAALVVIAVLLVLGVRAKAWSSAATWRSCLAVVVLVLLHAVVGWLLSFPLGIWPGSHALDHPYPLPGTLALLAASVFTTLLVARWQARRVDARSLLLACWLVQAVLAAVLAWMLPGTAYFLLLPAVVFTVLCVVEHVLRPTQFPAVAAWVGAVLSAWMAVYHFIFLDVLSYFHLAYLKTAVLGLGSIAALPLAARACSARPARGGLLLALAGVAALALVGYFVPTHTADTPRPVNIAYQQIEHSGETGLPGINLPERSHQWRMFTFGAPDKDYAAAAGFPEEISSFKRFGLRESAAYLQPATDLRLTAPRLRIDSDTTSSDGDADAESEGGGEGTVRTITGTLQAGRSGPILALTMAPGTPLQELKVLDKTLITADTYQADKGAIATFAGLGSSPVAFEVRVQAGQEFALVVTELSELPDDPKGREMVGLRPDNAAPIHFSDHAEVQHHYHF